MAAAIRPKIMLPCGTGRPSSSAGLCAGARDELHRRLVAEDLGCRAGREVGLAAQQGGLVVVVEEELRAEADHAGR